MVFSPPPGSSEDQNGAALKERERQVKSQANRWFLILLAVGIVLGGITAWGVVKLLSNLGLTGPAQPSLSSPKN